MLPNFITITLRNIRRYKVYSFINIAGISLGTACCILIFLWVQDELSFDTFHDNSDLIYRAAVEYDPVGQPVRYAVVPGPLAHALATEFPEIRQTVRFWRDISLESVAVGTGTVTYNEERFFFADPQVFEVFSFPLLHGIPESALADPFTLVITENTARKYFGDSNPVGRQLSVNLGIVHTFTITGILKNIPINFHITFDFLASMSSLNKIQSHHLINWNHAGFYTYLLLYDGATAETIERRLPLLVSRQFGAQEGSRLKFFLQPLTKIHLHSHLEDEPETNGNINTLYIFSTIAFLVLLTGCINFMNLSIAQSTSRSKEIGIRKVLGAYRKNIIRQFLGESLVCAFCALFIALCIVEIILPGFNDLTGKSMALDYGGNAFLVLALVGITLFSGLVSGSYPALLLSSFSPLGVLLKRTGHVSAHALLRKLLVVVQFAVSVVLIIATTLVYNQLIFFRNSQLGFSKEHVVVLPMREKHMQLNYESLRGELLNDERIVSASASSNIPCGPIIPQRREFRPEGFSQDELLALFCLFVDEDFLETYGIELIDGKNFSPGEYGTSFILNETAVRETGWQSPLGKKLSHWDPQTGKVIGVVKDFHFLSLHHELEPLALYYSPRWFQYLSIRIKPVDVAGTLLFIEEKWNEWFPHSPFDYSLLDSHVEERYSADRRLGKIIGVFALLAIFIACTGLFGLTSMTIEQRTKEIGIRKVLGASVASIVFLLSKEFTKLIVFANVIAWPAAWLAMKMWQNNFAYKAEMKLELFVFGSLITFIIALVTISYQTLKAVFLNPVESLRYE